MHLSSSLLKRIVPSANFAAVWCVGFAATTTLAADVAAPGGQNPARPPEMVQGKITLAGKPHLYTPNAVGSFPRIQVSPNQNLPAELFFSAGKPGETILVTAVDGGLVDGRPSALRTQLDVANKVAFKFTAGEAPGIYRVTVRRGREVKALEFWVGETPPVVRRELPPKL